MIGNKATGAGRLWAVAAFVEALTWAGLLTGMLLKYGTETTELGVWLFGRLHGGAFMFYVVVTIFSAARLRWPWWATMLAILAAIPPLVTLPLELWFQRLGLLSARKGMKGGMEDGNDSAGSPAPQDV